MAAARGRVDAVEPLLDAAERASAGAAEEPFEPTAGRAGSLLVNVPALIALHRSYLAMLRGDAEATAVFASRALAELGEGERMLEYVARFNLGMAEWLRGRLAEAERASCPASPGAAGRPTMTAWGRHILGQVQRAQGRLDAAARTCQQALEFTAPPGRPPLPAAGPAYVGLAEVAYQRNELDDALRHVTEGIALCRQFVYTPPLAAGLATLAWIRQATGDPAGALEAIGEARQAAPGPPGLLNPVPAQRARLLLAQGDLAAAARWRQNAASAPTTSRTTPASRVTWCWPGCCSPRACPAGARAAGPAARGGGRPGPGRQPHRDRRAAGAGAGGHRRRSGAVARPGRGAHAGLPAGLCPGLRRRGPADGRAARPADRGPARRPGGRRGPARLPGPAQRAFGAGPRAPEPGRKPPRCPASSTR